MPPDTLLEQSKSEVKHIMQPLQSPHPKIIKALWEIRNHRDELDR